MLISFLPLAAAFVTFLCCALVICRAYKWDLVDSPNHHSSHIPPTPSGGGIGLVLAGSFAGLYILLTQKPSFQNGVVLGISCILAAVGLLMTLSRSLLHGGSAFRYSWLPACCWNWVMSLSSNALQMLRLAKF